MLLPAGRPRHGTSRGLLSGTSTRPLIKKKITGIPASAPLSSGEGLGERGLYSIITVTYNSGTDLDRTLRSVAAQTYPHYECLIQDGGSTDGSPQKFTPRDKRFHLVSGPDGGIYDAMNRATTRSGGDWLLYLNAGDVFHDPGVLARLAPVLAAKEEGVVYGNVLGDYGTYQIDHRPASLDLLWLRKPFHHQAMFIAGSLARREAYDLAFPIVADHELAARLFRSGIPFSYLDETIATVDMRGGVSKDRYVATSRESLRVFNRHFFRADRLFLHGLHFLRLVVVKQLSPGLLARLRGLKNRER
ncbi:MAG: glycosyltransferase family 2 protein [Bacteroidota bacterium]